MALDAGFWRTRVLCLASMTWVLYWLGGSPAQAGELEPARHSDRLEATTVHSFDVLDFQVDGNTRLTQIALEQAVYPFMGPGRSLADVESARAALEQAYHAAGYMTVFVDVPQQALRDGRVRLQVTEGRIERLKVSGAQYHAPHVLRDGLSTLQPGEVPDFNAMQRELAQLGRSPDMQISPVMRPGQAPGTVEAELVVKDQLPLHGSVELNNRYSENTPRTRMSAALRYDNLWQAGHSIALDVATAPGYANQTTVWHASYMFPWQEATVALYALRSSRAVSTVGDIHVLGAGSVQGARWYGPGLMLGDWFNSLSAGLDHKAFRQSVRLGGEGGAGYETPIHYLPWQLQLQASRQTAAGLRSSASVAANWSLRGVGSSEAAFEDNRYKAHGSYFYLRGDGLTTLALGESRLQWRGNAQWSSQPLISNEQFASGGADTVRGYTESARAGDAGLSMQLEWQSAQRALPNCLRVDGAGAWQWLAFYDAAWLRVLEPLPAQTDHFALASVGLGWRVLGAGGLSASVDMAHALRPDAQGRKPVRLHSRLSVAF
jgi:hemolysin activation/secretion protein